MDSNRSSTSLRATIQVALLFLLFGTILLGQRNTIFDYRCMWVVRNALINERTIDEIIDFAFANHFNHLFVQVRGRGDALYNSNLVPRSFLLKDNKFDPLAYLLNKAHAKGIEVHAWVNVYLIWSAKSKPYSKNHLFNRYPDWIDSDGKTAVKLGNSYNSNDEGYYIAPHHPAVTPHLVAVFREIVAKYDIDGLHLDYIRYEDADFGNNPVAVQEYERTSKDNPRIFLSTKSITKNRDPQFSNKLSKWSDYRRTAVTDLVKQTKEMLLEVRPECILSAAVKPNLYRARNRFYQEWDVWLAAGYLDWAIPMNYTPSIREFATNIDLIYDNLPEKYRQRIIMGLATYNQSSIDVVDKIKYSRITHFPGISIFSYNVLRNNPRYFEPLRKILYP